MIPGNKHFKTKEISHQINSPRLSFAPAEFMEKYLDITPGSVSVMGLMNDPDNQVQLLVDEEGTFSRNLGQTMQGLVHRHSGIWALSPVFGENRRAVRAVPHGQDGQPRRLYPVHDSIPEAGITKRAVRS